MKMDYGIVVTKVDKKGSETSKHNKCMHLIKII